MTLARTKVTGLTDRSREISDAEFDEFWATPRPTTVGPMLGE